jgi:Putative Flp pilus-assembly TadE/G-like/von Willebrand factor type A domain
MTAKAFFERLRRHARELRLANGANVTITFALATIPMFGFVGAAVDYSHANSVKAAMQAAADSTALMLSKDVSSLTDSQLQTKANDYFRSLFNRPEVTGLTINVSYTQSTSTQLKLQATSDVKTSLMGILGFSFLHVGVNSQVKWGNTRLRVALALDNTGSMNDDGKMDALKIATANLLDQLKTAAKTNDDVYVSIIPFNRDVNVGKSNYKQDWIKWSGQTDTWDENNGNCAGYGGGVAPNSQRSCLSAGGKWNAKNHNSWNGCVMDRDQDYDTTNAAPDAGNTATLFPADQYGSCPVEMEALTYDWTALSNKVNSMTPNGMTNQTIGLQWAFQSLTASPFAIPPKDPNYKYSDVIILLTDGLNTQSRFTSSQSAIDARMTMACNNAKAAGITIYAVQVNTGGDPTQNVLKQCASDNSKFFELKRANDMVSTFNSIGIALSKLRIAE